MKQLERIGISNVTQDSDQVVHTSITHRATFGRVADLLCHWSQKEHQLPLNEVSNLRILIQALLEFSVREQNRSIPHIEMAITSDGIILAVRGDCGLSIEHGSVEKGFTQYWINSPESQFLKKQLNPHDRIEVRYQEQTGLVEWRVCRPIRSEQAADHVPSFLVFEDTHLSQENVHSQYTDLGDLPFQDWLGEAYRSTGRSNDAGTIRINADETVEDVSLSRFQVDHELSEISKTTLKSTVEGPDQSESIMTAEEEAQLPVFRFSQKFEGLEQKDESLRVILGEAKAHERRLMRESVYAQKRLQAYEDLLHRKELRAAQLQRKTTELAKELADARAKVSAPISQNNPFREKALQMYESLTKLKQENAELERMIFELRNKRSSQVSDADESDDKSFVARPGDDVGKKLERTLRALEAEKAKVASLSDRVMSAEREAEKSGPIIKDLESKVEHTLKVSLQHKKDVDAMKQKLVQSDAEKNKVQNELIKAQAQIQTLMKRQAS